MHCYPVSSMENSIGRARVIGNAREMRDLKPDNCGDKELKLSGPIIMDGGGCDGQDCDCISPKTFTYITSQSI
jgi:hypothetical protein